jgi:hypothetical protein
MNATLTFPDKQTAQFFATQWSRATLRGYVLSKNEVLLDGITEKEKTWIDSNIKQLNEKKTA